MSRKTISDSLTDEVNLFMLDRILQLQKIDES